MKRVSLVLAAVLAIAVMLFVSACGGGTGSRGGLPEMAVTVFLSPALITGTTIKIFTN